MSGLDQPFFLTIYSAYALANENLGCHHKQEPRGMATTALARSDSTATLAIGRGQGAESAKEGGA
jgi:hypothetical protein